jgi:branched-chain amino acid transport system ATP-binding protein
MSLARPAKRRNPSKADWVLETRGLTAGYGPLPVIHDVSLRVGRGQMVALLGANGAGKTTTMLALAGELPPTSGEVSVDGATIRAPLHVLARRGLGYVPEGRSLFFGLTVAENLRVANTDERAALDLFPDLERRSGVRAGLLSGGEQRMLALAVALARRPRLLLVDELSLGLAPLIVRRLLSALREAAQRDHVGVLFVEQHARKALQYADWAYVMGRGTIVLDGDAETMRGSITTIEDQYLAVGNRGQSPADQ